MSDRSPRQTDNNPADLDFSGLLPGDDQPRRRRGRRSANPRSSGRTEQTPVEQVGEEENFEESPSGVLPMRLGSRKKVTKRSESRA